eukprot:354206-Chlamydomonas_euryale.AAC.3
MHPAEAAVAAAHLHKLGDCLQQPLWPVEPSGAAAGLKMRLQARLQLRRQLRDRPQQRALHDRRRRRAEAATICSGRAAAACGAAATHELRKRAALARHLQPVERRKQTVEPSCCGAPAGEYGAAAVGAVARRCLRQRRRPRTQLQHVLHVLQQPLVQAVAASLHPRVDRGRGLCAAVATLVYTTSSDGGSIPSSHAGSVGSCSCC